MSRSTVHADSLFDPVLSLGELEHPPSHSSSYHRPPSRQHIQPPAGISNPQTRSPQNRRPLPIPSRSTRSPDLAALLADDYMRRDRDREMETELENAIRDAEAHRQRVAQFLSEGRSYSSFSTLRGALDENGAGDYTHPPPARRGGRPPVHPQPPNPPQASRPPPWEPPTELAPPAVTVDTASWTPWDSTFFDMNPFSDLDVTSSRAGTSQRPDDDFPHFSPPMPPRMPASFTEHPSDRSREGSYLEMNSRARSRGLSGLRYRYRPARSPSPPFPDPMSTPTSFFDPPASSSVPLADRLFPPRPWHNYSNTFAPRTSTDDAMLQSFNESMQPSAIPPPPVFYPVPSPDAPPPPPEPVPPPRQYGSFDLDAYRAGPFRATLARSMALQGQGQNRIDHGRGAATDERRLRDALESISDSELDEDDSESPPFNLLYRRQREFRRLHQRLNPTVRPRVTSSNPPASTRSSQTPASHASRSLDDPDFLTMSLAERRLASIRRASRPQDQTDRLRELLSRPTVTPAARHSTISDRERPISSVRDPPSGQPSARSSGLDRWEHRRDVLRRMTSRQTGRPDLPASSTTPSLAERISGIHEGPSPSVLSTRQRPAPRLRVYRPPSPPTSMHSTAGRGEPRAPLNGRFARPRGFPPHRPPDMVWVDFPSGRFPPTGRRRNFGDYMVRVMCAR